MEGPGDVAARVDARRAAPQVAKALSALSADEHDVLLLYALAELDTRASPTRCRSRSGPCAPGWPARRRAARHLAGTPATIDATEARHA